MKDQTDFAQVLIGAGSDRVFYFIGSRKKVISAGTRGIYQEGGTERRERRV